MARMDSLAKIRVSSDPPLFLFPRAVLLRLIVIIDKYLLLLTMAAHAIVVYELDDKPHLWLVGYSDDVFRPPLSHLLPVQASSIACEPCEPCVERANL